MRAIVYNHFQGSLAIKNVAVPEATSNAAVIQVKATGICRSDWHGWMGHDNDIHLPHVPGHEFAGIVSEIGANVRQFKPGDRVTTPFVCGCGHCSQCNTGNHQVCDNQTQPGFTHWGSFAEYVLVENADINLVRLPGNVSDTDAAALGCRFITAYRAVVDQAKVRANEFVAIYGCGGVGLSAIMICHALGAKVIGIDINDTALSLAKCMGADICLKASKSIDTAHEIRELTQGGVQVSIDALGSQITCFNSIASLSKRGRHVQLGLMTADHQHPKIPMDMVIARELEVYGSHGMQAYKYPDMFKFIKKHNLPLQSLIHQTITLEDALEILPKMGDFVYPGISVITSF